MHVDFKPHLPTNLFDSLIFSDTGEEMTIEMMQKELGDKIKKHKNENFGTKLWKKTTGNFKTIFLVCTYSYRPSYDMYPTMLNH